MPDRRRPERHAIETRLDDLQAEIEAEARTVRRLRGDAQRVESLFARHLQQAAFMGTLVHRLAELRTSIEQQRRILRELREEMATLRKPRAAAHRDRQAD